jgi:iron complex transport system permease protein
VERAKLISLLVTTLGVSAAVSISGLIGFVGLLMPHVSRMLFGGSNRIVIPTSAVLGAIFLLLANDIARDSLSYTEIPVGIITGLVGVPFFMYLLRRISRGGYVT